jgi:hypothetical protein
MCGWEGNRRIKEKKRKEKKRKEKKRKEKKRKRWLDAGKKKCAKATVSLRSFLPRRKLPCLADRTALPQDTRRCGCGCGAGSRNQSLSSLSFLFFLSFSHVVARTRKNLDGAAAEG